jgi:hypothetical protein
MPPLHPDDTPNIRNRAKDTLRSLRGQGFDRGHIMSFAAEMLGQLTETMRPDAENPTR